MDELARAKKSWLNVQTNFIIVHMKQEFIDHANQKKFEDRHQWKAQRHFWTRLWKKGHLDMNWSKQKVNLANVETTGEDQPYQDPMLVGLTSDLPQFEPSWCFSHSLTTKCGFISIYLCLFCMFKKFLLHEGKCQRFLELVSLKV